MTDSLSQIASEIAKCEKCKLYSTRKRTVPGEGPDNAKIMFIGEGPGYHENEQGRPFVGQAGKFLDELLASIKMKRADVFIANVVKCRPPQNRDPEPDELAACNDYLERQIALINPKAIVTLGSLLNGKVFSGRKSLLDTRSSEKSKRAAGGGYVPSRRRAPSTEVSLADRRRFQKIARHHCPSRKGSDGNTCETGRATAGADEFVLNER